MADIKSKEKKSGGWQIALLRKLTLAPEKRNEPPKGAYPGGRFKRFIDIIRSNFFNLSIANLLTLIFGLPLLAVIVVVAFFGPEKFSYLLNGIRETPYLLSDFGIGLSAGASLAATKAGMLISYRVLFLGVAASLPILGFGFAGLFYIATKLVWGESFICKKDKYGNDVPRIVIEFFRGVKLYWKQMLAVTAVFAVIVAGVSNLIINFIEGLWLHNLNAGDYIGLIIGCLVALPSVMILFNLLPMTVAYQLPLIAKVKNAAIVAMGFFVPTLFMAVLALAPFALIAGGTFLQMMAALIFAMIGFAYFALLSVNYLGYNSEKILVPLYEQSIQTEKKKNKKVKNSKK